MSQIDEEGYVRVRVRTTHMSNDDIDYVVRRLLRQANEASPTSKKRAKLLEHAELLQRYRQQTEQGPDGRRRMKHLEQ
jgi:hypothetical protein